MSMPRSDHAYSFTSDSYCKLPRYVTFKDSGGKYLKPVSIFGLSYLQFAGEEVADPGVTLEIFPLSDGSVNIQFVRTKKFWGVSFLGALAAVGRFPFNISDKKAAFWPIKVDDNTIALRYKDHFCKKFTFREKVFLCPKIASIVEEAKLIVEEPVMSRRIYNVKYKLNEAEIYGHSHMTVVKKTVHNSKLTSDVASVDFRHTHTRTKAWESNNSWKKGVTCTIETKVPTLNSKVTVETSGERSGSYKWGESESTTTDTGSSHQFFVGPMTRVDMSVVASSAKCKVPFSYTQTDLLYDGRQITCQMDDGIFRGANLLDFDYVTTEQKMTKD